MTARQEGRLPSLLLSLFAVAVLAGLWWSASNGWL